MDRDKIEILKKIEEIIKSDIESNTGGTNEVQENRTAENNSGQTNGTQNSDNRLNRHHKINDIIDNSWCEYSDLPSPMWYKNKKETD
jgi:hypothetical protein